MGASPTLVAADHPSEEEVGLSDECDTAGPPRPSPAGDTLSGKYGLVWVTCADMPCLILPLRRATRRLLMTRGVATSSNSMSRTCVGAGVSAGVGAAGAECIWDKSPDARHRSVIAKERERMRARLSAPPRCVAGSSAQAGLSVG